MNVQNYFRTVMKMNEDDLMNEDAELKEALDMVKQSVNKAMSSFGVPFGVPMEMLHPGTSPTMVSHSGFADFLNEAIQEAFRIVSNTKSRKKKQLRKMRLKSLHQMQRNTAGSISLTITIEQKYLRWVNGFFRLFRKRYINSL